MNNIMKLLQMIHTTCLKFNAFLCATQNKLEILVCLWPFCWHNFMKCVMDWFLGYLMAMFQQQKMDINVE
jgi:hypothetical protein